MSSLSGWKKEDPDLVRVQESYNVFLGNLPLIALVVLVITITASFKGISQKNKEIVSKQQTKERGWKHQ